MKTFRRILILCLAALMVLTLAACKKKDTTDTRAAEEIISAAPLCLQVLTDAEITIGMDENGNALAAVGTNDNGTAAIALCEDVAGKSGAEAVKSIVSVLVENDYLVGKPYVILRQKPGTILPSDDYLTNVAAAAAEVAGDYAVIVISAADMDEDGYFNEVIAEQIIKAFLGDDVKILGTSVMIDGCYIISCELDYTVSDYSVGAYYGGVAPYVDLQGDTPLEEEETVPEEQQFEPSDDPEGIYGEEDQSAEDVDTTQD